MTTRRKGRNLSGKTDDTVFDFSIKRNQKLNRKEDLEIWKLYEDKNNSDFKIDRSLLSGDTTYFSISSSTGNISISTALDIKGDFTVDSPTLHVDSNNNFVGIGTNNPSTLLELKSKTGALLLTRLTMIERDALTGINGMCIYNSTTNAFNFYENDSWVTK